MNSIKKLLVVDDDSRIRELLESYFKTEGYEVDTADDGKSGFEKGVQGNYDLIIFDVKMPEWNGIEAMVGLKLMNIETRFIVVSGYIDNLEIERMSECDHILKIFTKPFDLEEIGKFVKDYLKDKDL